MGFFVLLFIVFVIIFIVFTIKPKIQISNTAVSDGNILPTTNIQFYDENLMKQYQETVNIETEVLGYTATDTDKSYYTPASAEDYVTFKKSLIKRRI